jgi:hypothetical protein
MFLPWYGKSVTETVRGSLRAAGYTLSAFGAFSFVEAAVLLVATSVLVLLFARGERRAFHLPGGDGGVIFAAGLWTGLLIFYRMLDKPRTTGNAQLTTTIGLQWGIFVAMAGAVALAYAGTRMRAARRPEPAPVEDPTLRPPRTRPAPSRRPDRPPPGTPRPTAAALGPVGLPPPGTPRPSAAPPRPAGRAEPEEDAPTEVAPGDSADPETEPVPPFDFEAAERTRRRSARRRGPDGVPEFDPFGER